MTALTKYQRLEASGLWRASPEDQRREVIVSVGEATLTITDMADRALTHWSLAAIERRNPGVFPAIYGPDGDQTETLELDEGETEMIAAIEKLRNAIERARPRPGRLRLASVLAMTGAVAAALALWLPGALRDHTVAVVPAIKRQEIGRSLLARIERLTGTGCRQAEAGPALAALARRTGVRQVMVIRSGVSGALWLPGGTVLVDRRLIEDHEDPAIAAGHILAARAGALDEDPLNRFLGSAGLSASFRLLTTGEVTTRALEDSAERTTSGVSRRNGTSTRPVTAPAASIRSIRSR